MSVHEIRQRDKVVAIYDVLKFLLPGSSTDKVKKRLEKAGVDFPQQYHAIKQRVTNIRGFGRGVGTPAIHIDHLEELLSLLPSLPKGTAAQLVATLKEHVEMGTRVIQITAHKQYLPAAHAAAQAAAMNHLQHTMSGAPMHSQNGAMPPPAHANGAMPIPYPMHMQPPLSTSCQMPTSPPPSSPDGRKRKAPEPSGDLEALWQRAHHLVATVETSTAELKHVLAILGQHYHQLQLHNHHHHRHHPAPTAAAAVAGPGMAPPQRRDAAAAAAADQGGLAPHLAPVPPVPPPHVQLPPQAAQLRQMSPVATMQAAPGPPPRRLSPVGP